MSAGLKDHQIAQLVSAVTRELRQRIPGLPHWTREVVSNSIIENLEAQGARLDLKGERICMDCGLRRGGSREEPNF